MKRVSSKFLTLLIALTFASALAGCASDGFFGEVGESLDETGEEVRDEIDDLS